MFDWLVPDEFVEISNSLTHRALRKAIFKNREERQALRERLLEIPFIELETPECPICGEIHTEIEANIKVKYTKDLIKIIVKCPHSTSEYVYEFKSDNAYKSECS